MFYNFDYGFIEGTRAGDGDHTDALLIIDEPTFTGCHVWARPIGGLEMRDEKGFDFKVLCVALGDPHQQHIERLDQVRPHRLVEIEHFFETYKLLEDKTVEVVGWREHDRALEVLRSDRATWQHETGERRVTRPTAAARRPRTGRGRARSPAVRRGAAPGRAMARSPRSSIASGPRRARRRPRRPLGPPRRAPPDPPVPRPDAAATRRRGRGDAVRDAAPLDAALRRRPRRRGRVPERRSGRGRCGWASTRASRSCGVARRAVDARRSSSVGWAADGRPFRPHLTVARSDGVPAGAGHRAPG